MQSTNNYFIGDNPSTGAMALEGANFGVLSNLSITSCDMKYWSDTQDRLGGAFYYKVMSADGLTEIVPTTEILWDQTALGGNDFQGTKFTNTNLLNGLSVGTYQLHVWAKSWGPDGDSWLSNGGLNYVASFTYNTPVSISGANGIADNTSFATLKAAFDAINAQPDQAGKDIEVKIGGTSIETADATLTQPATAIWNSLTIYPTVENAAIKTEGQINLIDLNGADKVLITGKLNKTGDPKNLTIESRLDHNGARTFRLWNDASNITISHCIIKGSNTSSGSGVLFISNTNGTTGNDNITISNNDFNMSGSKSPHSAIYAAGQSGKMNDRITIDNNNFFNLYNGETFYAIRIAAHNSQFTISNNNIYEPNVVTPIDAKTFNGITILSTAGDQFIVSNNFIGGNAPGAVGTFSKSNEFSNDFVGIFTTVSLSSENGANIYGNVIKNIEWKNADVKKDFTGMQTFGNAINIGDLGANTISDITWENGAISGGEFYGINMQNTTGLNIAENNMISNISISNTNTAHGSNFFGLFKSNSTGAIAFKNNTIKEISVTGSSTDNPQLVAGIHLNYVSGTQRAYTFEISGNQISNLANGTARNDEANAVFGIYTKAPLASGAVAKNKIFNIVATSSANPAIVYGINMNALSTTLATTCSNNMVSIGNTNPAKVYGIYQTDGLVKVYHNSVYLAGNPSEGSFESSALVASGATVGREFLNNILINARSNAGTADGKHFAVKYAAATDLASNYNVVSFAGTGGTLGMVGAVEYVSGQDWVDATNLDTNSKITAVNFSNVATADLTIAGASIQDTDLKVPSLAEVTTDMLGTVRNTEFTYAGAHESTLPFIVSANNEINVSANVYTTHKGIVIHTTAASQIEIYSINGWLVDKAMVNGRYTKDLDAGVYLVRINGTTRKIVK